MTISARATIKWPTEDPAAPLVYRAVLQQHEPTVFRWAVLSAIPPLKLQQIDFVTRHDAIKWLRLQAESDPAWVGVDLTINAAEQPPHIRAAERIWGLAEDIDQPDVESIILEETNISDLLEHAGVLLAYLIRTGRQAKPPGLDMAEAGLILNVIEAIEKAERCDLGNLKKTLTADVNKVQVYSSMPPKGGVQ